MRLKAWCSDDHPPRETNVTRTLAAPTVCYHARRRCGFCGIPAPKMGRARLRCACCGRFRRHTPAEDPCPVCSRRGFVALRLFA